MIHRLATIYALRDPVNGETRYIGKTLRPLKQRLGRHLGDALRRKCGTYRSRWIRTLTQPPTIDALMTVQASHAAAAEQYAIAIYRSIGYPLTNLTNGGDGTLGYVASPETCAKISAAKKGQIIGSAQRVQISKTLTGRSVPQCVRDKISAAHKGRKKNAETRARMSEATKGHFVSAETRAKIGAKSKGRGLGRKVSDETRAKMSAAQRSRPARRRCSVETRMRMSESHRKRPTGRAA